MSIWANVTGVAVIALAHVRSERGQVPVDAAGQPLGQPVFDGSGRFS